MSSLDSIDKIFQDVRGRFMLVESFVELSIKYYPERHEVVMSQFVVEQYKPEGGFSVAGLPILMGTLCVAGAGLGWLASFIGQKFYLILLFPVGIGGVLVVVGSLAGRVAKMRSTGMAMLLGVISAVVAMTTMHYCDFKRFMDERDQILKDAGPALDNPPPGMNAEGIEALKVLKQLRGVDSFPSYLDFAATQGVTISKRGNNGLNLGYVGTWIYWVVELAVVAVMTVVGLVAGAAAPFCSTCDVWKKERHLGTLQQNDADVAALLREGEIERLQNHNPTPKGGELILTAAVCPKCETDSPVAVKLVATTKNKKGEVEKKELAHLVYPGEKLAELEAVFKGERESAVE